MIAWQAALKRNIVKLDILTDIDMLLMVEKGIRGRMCHSIYQYAKANNKYMIKIKNCHTFNIGMPIIYMSDQCCKSSQQIILSA